MYCKNCGKEINPSDKFCIHCGSPVNTPDIEKAEDTEPNAEEKQLTTEEKLAKREKYRLKYASQIKQINTCGWWSSIFVFLVLVIGMLVPIFKISLDSKIWKISENASLMNIAESYLADSNIMSFDAFIIIMLVVLACICILPIVFLFTNSASFPWYEELAFSQVSNGSPKDNNRLIIEKAVAENLSKSEKPTKTILRSIFGDLLIWGMIFADPYIFFYTDGIIYTPNLLGIFIAIAFSVTQFILDIHYIPQKKKEARAALLQMILADEAASNRT